MIREAEKETITLGKSYIFLEKKHEIIKLWALELVSNVFPGRIWIHFVLIWIRIHWGQIETDPMGKIIWIRIRTHNYISVIFGQILLSDTDSDPGSKMKRIWIRINISDLQDGTVIPPETVVPAFSRYSGTG